MKARLVLASLALSVPTLAVAQWEGVVVMKMTSAQMNGTSTAWVSKAGMKSQMDLNGGEMA